MRVVWNILGNRKFIYFKIRRLYFVDIWEVFFYVKDVVSVIRWFIIIWSVKADVEEKWGSYREIGFEESYVKENGVGVGDYVS